MHVQQCRLSSRISPRLHASVAAATGRVSLLSPILSNVRSHGRDSAVVESVGAVGGVRKKTKHECRRVGCYSTSVWVLLTSRTYHSARTQCGYLIPQNHRWTRAFVFDVQCKLLLQCSPISRYTDDAVSASSYTRYPWVTYHNIMIHRLYLSN